MTTMGTGHYIEHTHTDCSTIFNMFRRTPGKMTVDDADIDDIITPPGKGEQHGFADTPPTSNVWMDAGADLDGSYSETSRRPLGRFLSFDVKRSLFSSTFSSKRHAEFQTIEDDESPIAKRLRESEKAISSVSLESSTPTPDAIDIKSVVHRLSTEDDLVADGSRSYSLPTIAGKHQDLKSITPDTMSEVLRGCYDDKIDQVSVIDCRYPYEFQGGHIEGALNLYTRAAVQNFLTQNCSTDPTKRHVLIFHCEFSSERGPKMYRFLRSQDRTMNKDNYPRLYFPEVYLLDSGYKAFYYTHRDQCLPQSYMPMLHKDHASDLRHFRGKSKSWTAGEKSNMSRLSLRF